MTRAIAIVGPGDAPADLLDLARHTGALCAQRGWTLLTGGLGGVMAAASAGAAQAGGLVVGVLPGEHARDANPHVRIAIATGMGQARNVVLINSADAVVAIGRNEGTLSEVALALRAGKPVVSLRSYGVEINERIVVVDSPEHTAAALDAARGTAT